MNVLAGGGTVGQPPVEGGFIFGGWGWGPVRCAARARLLLVPGHKYPKTGIKEIYGKTSVRVCAPIQMIPLHFRVLMAWDKYCRRHVSGSKGRGLGCQMGGSDKHVFFTVYFANPCFSDTSCLLQLE